jgi:hypothetical protein
MRTFPSVPGLAFAGFCLLAVPAFADARATDCDPATAACASAAEAVDALPEDAAKAVDPAADALAIDPLLPSPVTTEEEAPPAEMPADPADFPR